MIALILAAASVLCPVFPCEVDGVRVLRQKEDRDVSLQGCKRVLGGVTPEKAKDKTVEAAVAVLIGRVKEKGGDTLRIDRTKVDGTAEGYGFRCKGGEGK